MKLLILGGTIFLGRHIVDSALSRGHEVTLFNRGQHGADLFPDVERLKGSRDGGLDSLRGRQWDAVIDTCGYSPRVVRDSASLLAQCVEHYTFISTISVYSDFSQPGVDETSPVGTLSDPGTEEVTGGSYGPLKALCENAVEEQMPGRALNIRPGLIVGPCDPTDRFTYWPHRVARGGDVLAPDPPGAEVQFIDVRDLAEWTVLMSEARRAGVFNATGPDHGLSMGTVLESCQRVSRSDAHLVWVSEQFLLDSEVQPWMELPLWLPGAEYSGLGSVDCRKAIAAGLRFRPLEETVRDTLAWDATRPADREFPLKREKESDILMRWKEHQRAGSR